MSGRTRARCLGRRMVMVLRRVKVARAGSSTRPRSTPATSPSAGATCSAPRAPGCTATGGRSLPAGGRGLGLPGGHRGRCPRLLRGPLPGRHLPRLPPGLGRPCVVPGRAASSGSRPAPLSRRTRSRRSPPSSGRRSTSRASTRASSGRRRRSYHRSCPYALPSVPVLVLNGDLDIVTTTSEAEAAAARFPHATYVEVASLRPRDRARLLRRLRVRDHAALRPDANAGLTRAVPRACPRCARSSTSRAARPRSPASLPGPLYGASACSPPDRRSGGDDGQDAVQRWQVNFSGTGRGLRGGTWFCTTATPSSRSGCAGRWFVGDVAVSGTVTWTLPPAGPGPCPYARPGPPRRPAHARLVVAPAARDRAAARPG